MRNGRKEEEAPEEEAGPRSTFCSLASIAIENWKNADFADGRG
jgi:hypothetical protein